MPFVSRSLHAPLKALRPKMTKITSRGSCLNYSNVYLKIVYPRKLDLRVVFAELPLVSFSWCKGLFVGKVSAKDGPTNFGIGENDPEKRKSSKKIAKKYKGDKPS